MPKPELRRRAGEEEYEDPADQSLVRKLSKLEIPGGPVVDVLIRVIVMLFVGGGAGFVANEHATANDAETYNTLTAVKADFERFRTSYYARSVSREADRQKEREETLQRLTAIETELRLMRGRR